MKIAIIGYGKMGRMIEKAAIGRGHEICCIVEEGEESKFSTPEFMGADVAIDFTVPSAEPGNVLNCFRAGVPVVCGTTGWKESLGEVEKLCRQGEGTLLWSSNFSVGVNIFRAVNRFLARIMDSEPQYRPEESETHHIHKLDHPSGTAVTLAEEIVSSVGRLKDWRDVGIEGETPETRKEVLTASEGIMPVEYRREGEVAGIHTVRWISGQDEITLSHSAKSREGFALGAVIAAEWLKGKKGYFTTDDVFKWTE